MAPCAARSVGRRESRTREHYENHFGCTNGSLQEAIVSTFEPTINWLSSPLTCHPSFAHLASADHQDGTDFGSLHDAYTYKWVGTIGQFIPPAQRADTLASLHHAIACTKLNVPACNIGVIRKPDIDVGVSKLLGSPSVQILAELGLGTAGLGGPDHWHNRKSNRTFPFKMLLILVANPKGMRKYAVQHRVSGLRTQLDRVRWEFYSWMGDTKSPHRRRNQRPPQMVIRAALPPAAPLHTPMALPALEYQATYPRLFADPDSITYTDGSKTGTSVTAAICIPSANIEQAIRLQGHDPVLNTALQGELVAIHEALRIRRNMPDRDHDDVIMTDCQVALQLIRLGLFSPERLRAGKHRHIVMRIATMVAAWPRGLRLLKVRAHVDVHGNTQADKCATQAHENETVPTTDVGGNGGRSQHWIMMEERLDANGLADRLVAINSSSSNKRDVWPDARRSHDKCYAENKAFSRRWHTCQVEHEPLAYLKPWCRHP